MTLRRLLSLLTIALLAVAYGPTAESDDPEAKPGNAIKSPEIAKELTVGAQRFLAAIEADRQARWLNAKFHFDDQERGNFHFFPIPRRGVSLKQLKVGQRQMAYALMSIALSHAGNQKALAIMSLGDNLRESDENPNQFRDSDQYYITVFGEPTMEGTWGYRVEGFHLSLNVTVVAGQWISVTPSFFGAIPAVVGEGPRQGLEVLAQETNLGRSLAASLTPEQRKTGFGELPVFEETVGGLLTGNQRRIQRGRPRGLSAAQMSAPQRELLWRLINEHVGRIRRELAAQDLTRMQQAGLDRIHFVWAGRLESGQPHHYLIQGPTFLIEYDCTQDDANHVHCVYRDFDNDFGDALLEHYHRHEH